MAERFKIAIVLSYRNTIKNSFDFREQKSEMTFNFKVTNVGNRSADEHLSFSLSPVYQGDVFLNSLSCNFVA